MGCVAPGEKNWVTMHKLSSDLRLTNWPSLDYVAGTLQVILNI